LPSPTPPNAATHPHLSIPLHYCPLAIPAASLYRIISAIGPYNRREKHARRAGAAKEEKRASSAASRRGEAWGSSPAGKLRREILSPPSHQQLKHTHPWWRAGETALGAALGCSRTRS
jgi:hypothetical protein